MWWLLSTLMLSRTLAVLLSAFLLSLGYVSAQVTIYAQFGVPISAQPPPCVGAVPCDGSVLQPVGPQDYNITNTNTIPIQLYSGGMSGLSMPIPSHFFGFSLEMSVADQLLGDDPARINPIFMNLMSTVIARSNTLFLRVGGNSQEGAVLIPGGLKGGAMIEIDAVENTTTQTPDILFSPTLIYAMSNISGFLPTIRWFLGAPFNDTQDPRMDTAELAQQVLGDKLIGLQLGNEPDLYFQNGIRGPDYTPAQYDADWGKVLNDYVGNPNIQNNSMFLAPSVCCGGTVGWTLEEVWNTGFLDQYKDHLAYISAQHYPSDNCNRSAPHDPQALLPAVYLNHRNNQRQNRGYLNSTAIAQSLGKPFLLFETNSALCGGFSGLSDSFAAALWAVDYSLVMAMGNISHEFFHVGGLSAYYNPFTFPSPNQTHFRQWTVGSTFYAALVVAEALGKSNTARVADLYLNDNSDVTPGYVFFEGGNPARVLLMNFITDPTGSGNYTAYISVGGNSTGQPNATPAGVQVKYLLSSSVSEKFDITWAGQTFGGPFESDGRLSGDEVIYTYACDQANNVCAVPVPAPGLALVFLNSDALRESTPQTTQTFATSITAAGAANTATVGQAVLATSNGRGGVNWNGFGSTSFGSAGSGALGLTSMLASSILLGALVGAVVVFVGAEWR